MLDATVVGLGAMIGAGIFVAIGAAADVAGAAMTISLGIAAVVAFANAASTAQLAAVHPESGGAYAYGRARLGHAWGFLAGWSFLGGKLASCAAMALTAGLYLWADAARPIAAAAVVALTAVNLLGIGKTARVTRVLVVIVLAVLAAVVVAGLGGGDPDVTRLELGASGAGFSDVLAAAGILFFAFAGYARIATLSEEVRRPRVTIPRAVVVAFVITLGVYAAVTLASLASIGAPALAAADAPLEEVVRSAGAEALVPVVAVGAGVAALSVLLSLLAGVSRTAFAMADRRDAPRALAAVSSRTSVPHVAQIAAGAIVTAVVLLADVRDAIGFSAFAILVYYAVSNAAALRMSRDERIWPRWLSVFGLAACIALALLLPVASVIGGLVLMAAIAVGYALRRQFGGG